MNLQLLKELEDLKEEHLRLSQELYDLHRAGYEAFKGTGKEAFIGYFSKNGFVRADDSGGSGITMKYKGLTVCLGEYVDGVLNFRMRDVFEHIIQVHQDCDEHQPTHVNEKAALESRIAYEVKTINALKEAITNFTPCRCYLTLDKQTKQYDGFSDIADKLIER
jgi:hypothetical protein